MKEIRVCRKGSDSSQPAIAVVRAGRWHPDSPGNREMLRVIVDSGNEIDGPGTHWVEVREGVLLGQQEKICN
jgi:hypothetical protein